MPMDRRKALGLIGGAAALAPAAGAAETTVRLIFLHGVASGDPLPDRVVLWTCVTGAPGAAIEWEVAEDPAFVRIARRGRATQGAMGTVKVDATGLKPGRDYHYRFRALGQVSPVGRLRTAARGRTDQVVFAVANCALYPGGYFHAYAAIAAEPRLDAVIHLGDYIYEYGAGPNDYGMNIGARLGRAPEPPHELRTLDDYRTRYSQVRRDPEMQAAHARAPFICIWDDHETADNSWAGGAGNHQPNEGAWDERKSAAVQAWYEWMPIREPRAGAPREAIQRSFVFGDVARLVMVESRLVGRALQLDLARDMPMTGGVPDVAALNAKRNDPARQLLGEAQEAWIASELAASTRAGETWQVIGNQLVMARVTYPDFKGYLGEARYAALAAALPAAAKPTLDRLAMLAPLKLPYNLDAWDGYGAARSRFYAAAKAAKASPIVLSGDAHAFWANELWHDDGGSRVAAEFGAASVTSPGLGERFGAAPLNETMVHTNPEVKYTDQSAHGYVRLTLTRQSARADMVAVSTVVEEAFETRVLRSFNVEPSPGGGVGPLRDA